MGELIRCIDCGSSNTVGPDFEGFQDCLDCGAAWIPAKATTDTKESGK